MEGAFDRIIRTGTNPCDYKWTVTDKKVRSTSTNITFATRLSFLDGSPIFRWYLQASQDLLGNRVEYSYLRDQGQLGGEPWVQLYPRDINYSSNVKSDGRLRQAAHYGIHFVLDVTDWPFGRARTGPTRSPAAIGLPGPYPTAPGAE